MGFCYCGLITDRLYNFNGTGGSDPTMDAGLLATLRDRCPPRPHTENASRADRRADRPVWPRQLLLPRRARRESRPAGGPGARVLRHGPPDRGLVRCAAEELQEAVREVHVEGSTVDGWFFLLIFFGINLTSSALTE
jgi:hypothetical protein